MPSLSSSLSSRSSLVFVAIVLGSLAACTHDEEHASLDAKLGTDGYALFQVDNERQQRDDVVVTVREVEPGASYVLLYSEGAPSNVGWFLFDPASKSRCGGDPGAHCEVPGYGYMVDVATAPHGADSVTLRDGRCGCDAKDYESSWTGHWAVMRVDRPSVSSRTLPVTVEVVAKELRDYAREPTIHQLQ
jgi:hypothetical protein